MRFDADDLDWAMGELFALFARASRYGVEPHRLDAALFHEAWTLLNEQPFPVRMALYEQLMVLRRPRRAVDDWLAAKGRYENAVPH